MRSDEKLDADKRRPDQWSPPRGADSDLLDSETPLGMSFSGHERDHLFLNLHGSRFLEVSGLSGLDSVADGRTFVYFDYDRDGYHDIALTNNNRPQFELFRNQLGTWQAGHDGRSNFVALRFVGGNRGMHASPFSARDGYGARVQIEAGELRLVREHRCGDGRAGQNSATMLVGLGDEKAVDRIIVRWPSGKVQETTNVPAGTLLTWYENPAESPDGSGWRSEPYRRPESQQLSTTMPRRAQRRLEWATTSPSRVKPTLKMYTTMATWCDACKRHLPLVQHLRATFDDEALGIYGVPTDRADTREMLEHYEAQYHPGYDLLTDLSTGQVDDIVGAVREALRTDALPATVVTDDEGQIVATVAGVPTVSQLRKWMSEAQRTRVAEEARQSLD